MILAAALAASLAAPSRAAAPAAAATAAAPAPAPSLKPASCLKGSKAAPAPKTFDDFRDCQAGAREDVVSAAEGAGKPLTSEQMETVDEYQRAEARRFLAKPGMVASGSDKPAGTGDASARADAASKGKLGGVTGADLKRVDAKSGASIASLQERLHAAAGDGKNGITPAMADDIRATLTQAQGGLSPEMKNLLDAVERDGGKLTPETMKLIQGAAQSAKGAGLNLNIDPGAEKNILDHDFDADKPAYDAAQSPPTN